MYDTFDFNASKCFIHDHINFACIIGAPFFINDMSYHIILSLHDDPQPQKPHIKMTIRGMYLIRDEIGDT